MAGAPPIESQPVPLRTDETGSLRIGRTRVTLDILIATYRSGYTAEEIVEQLPTLELSEVHCVLGYYLRHRKDLDAYLDERERSAAALRQTIEASGSGRTLRQRVLARRARRDV